MLSTVGRRGRTGGRGRIRTTATDTLSPINAANLIEAHRHIESATTRGKIVLEGWASPQA